MEKHFIHRPPQTLTMMKQFVQACNEYYNWPGNAFEDGGSGKYLRLILPGVEGIVSGAWMEAGHVIVELDFNEQKVSFALLDLEAPEYKEPRR